MNQMVMDFTARKLARNTDPITSHAAASAVAGFARSHQELLLNALRDFGPGTYHEAAARCGIEAHSAGRRFNELERAGLIRVVIDGKGDEMVRKTPSNRSARVWFAV